MPEQTQETWEERFDNFQKRYPEIFGMIGDIPKENYKAFISQELSLAHAQGIQDAHNSPKECDRGHEMFWMCKECGTYEVNVVHNSN